MNTGWIVWGLFMSAMFLLGLCFIILSTKITNWVFSWSTKVLGGEKNIPNIKSQKSTLIWILRIFGIFICLGSLAMFISALFAN